MATTMGGRHSSSRKNKPDMYIIKGTRTARIRTYKEHNRRCDNCKDFDLIVKVYKQYYHVFFIPVVAAGIKTSSIQCNKCGLLIRSDALSKEYETKTRAPFYLYSGVIAVSLFVLSMVGVSIWRQLANKKYIDHPAVGDVYLVKKHSAFADIDEFYFIRVKQITADSVKGYENHTIYGFAPSGFSPEDYFEENSEVAFTQRQLKEMQEKDTIENVYRGYEAATGFDRVK